MTTLNVVYVLTNPVMPGLVKIGYTLQQDANSRIGQLYTTGVPVPFKLEFACKVANAEEVERALHKAFAPYRINPKREFFRIEPEQAIAILKLLHVEEATVEIDQQPSQVDPQSIAAAEQVRARRPNINFEEMGIPIGAELKSIRNDVTVTILNSKKVLLNGEELSLTAATRKILNLEYDVAPAPQWTYEGRLLNQIYRETYGI